MSGSSASLAGRARGVFRPFRPRSLSTLVLVGILMVTFPLAVGFVISSLQVKRLAEQGQQAVYQSVRTTQEVRVLVAQIGAMERAARQYSLTKDASRFDSYQELRTDWRKRVERRIEIDNHARFSEILDTEHAVFDVLSQATSEKPLSVSALEQLSTLADELRTLLTSSAAVMDAEVDIMNSMAKRARTVLSGVGATVAILALGFATVFYLLISKALRQLDGAITRLGDGDFEARVAITGPDDIESLGRRLEWLRMRLRELEAQKTIFLRNMSHELKTPLTALREGSDLMSQSVLGPLNTAQQEVAEILRVSSMRLERDIEQLLQCSRLPVAGHKDMRLEVVSLSEELHAVVQDYRLPCQRKSLEVTSFIDDAEVVGDRQKLRTAFDNLFSNAVKYTPPGGSIIVGVEQSQTQTHIDVCDSGPGVRVSERERIFEPFYQSKDQPKGSVRGSGIGLSIARECIKLHDGELSVVDREHAGACFRLTLPRTTGGVLTKRGGVTDEYT
ncbi:MAG: HAMP domain-containing protein [Gammaproteobacteria bacterium]|nr:HAMP domain-containing protein [Gammaproteobacteria bacterium]